MKEKHIIKIGGSLKDSKISGNKTMGGTFLEVGGSAEGTEVKDNLHIDLRNEKKSSKKWWEKPIGIIFLSVIAGLIVAGTVYYLGWTP